MKTVIHNVLIVDKSSSMLGSKYKAAIEGIKLELEALKKDDKAFYTQTIIEFSSKGGEGFLEHDTLTNVEHCFMIPLANVHSLNEAGADGNTPLYQTIGETIEKLLRYVNKDERVLIKVFTDGQENRSTGKYKNPKVLKELIDRVEESNNFLITWEGTKFDAEIINREVGINFSKMSFHDNTAEGITKSYMRRTSATMAYSDNLFRGKDVGDSFYSQDQTDNV